LAEAVRALAADRDQVLARIAALERNLDGVTGTIKRDRTVNPQQAPAQSAPQTPAAAIGAAPVAEVAVTPAQTPASPPSGASDAAQMVAPDAGNRAETPPANLVRVTARAEQSTAAAAAAGLGVDVGGAVNYEGLRTLWLTTRNSNPALLEALYPVVAVRENGKTHGVDLRLVVGPIADAETAARLCTALSAAHRYCQPIAFEGQRLSLTDTAPAKAAPTLSHQTTSHAPAQTAVPEIARLRALIGK
jgi:hypothetical protein